MSFLTTAIGAASSGLLHAYVLENPWPLGIVLAGVGVIVAIVVLRQGRLARLSVAGALLAAGGVVILLGIRTTTPGEHAEQVARALVAAVEGNDLTGADRLLSDEMTYGATDLRSLPHGGKGDIMRAITEFNTEITLEENRMSSVDIATVSGDEGQVRFSLWTEASGGISQVPVIGRSNWILVVRRDPDGIWRVHRIIWVELNGSPPPIHRI